MQRVNSSPRSYRIFKKCYDELYVLILSRFLFIARFIYVCTVQRKHLSITKDVFSIEVLCKQIPRDELRNMKIGCRLSAVTVFVFYIVLLSFDNGLLAEISRK